MALRLIEGAAQRIQYLSHEMPGFGQTETGLSGQNLTQIATGYVLEYRVELPTRRFARVDDTHDIAVVESGR